MRFKKTAIIGSYIATALLVLSLGGCASQDEMPNAGSHDATGFQEDAITDQTKLSNSLYSGAYAEAASYYTDTIARHPEAQSEAAEAVYTFMEDAVDQYNHNVLSEADFRSAVSSLESAGLDLSVYEERFETLYNSKASYARGLGFLAEDDISGAVDAFGQVIAEDTLYEKIVPLLLSKAKEYSDEDNYLPATILYRRLESVFGEDVIVEMADTYRMFGDFLAEKNSTDLAISAYALSYACDHNSETFNKYAPLYASKHLIGIGGYNLIVLKSDGTAITASRSGTVALEPDKWENLLGVGASWEAYFGLTSDRTVISDGYFYHKVNTDKWSNVLNMYVGYLDVGGVISTGGANGELTNNTGNVESDLYNIEEFGMIYVGGDCHVGLRWDGTVTMLRTENGEAHRSVTNGDISGWTDIASVFVNLSQVVAVREDGTVYSAGSADLSGWTDIVKVTGSAGNFLLGLKADGTVVSYSTENMWGADDVSGWTDIIDIATNTESRQYTVGVKKDGTLVAVGNSYVDDLIGTINSMSGVGVPEY